MISQLGDFYIGQKVSQQFPTDPGSKSLTPIITGIVVKLWETQNAGWAVVKDDNGFYRAVCLG